MGRGKLEDTLTAYGRPDLCYTPWVLMTHQARAKVNDPCHCQPNIKSSVIYPMLGSGECGGEKQCQKVGQEGSQWEGVLFGKAGESALKS